MTGIAPLVDRDGLETQLHAALATLALPLDGAQRLQLIAYLALLAKWNRTYNLTAIRDPESMLRQHVLDCLSIVAPIDAILAQQHSQRPQTRQAPLAEPTGAPLPVATPTPVAIDLLDVGSGAGLPGLILAIARPQYRVTMIDAVQKKAAFIAQAIIELGLTNAQALHGRVEHYQPARPPVLITSRAFAALKDFVSSVQRIAGAQTILVAMKGQNPRSTNCPATGG
jgi:16S rRNA (guanine527-N7)-methyltransferase